MGTVPPKTGTTTTTTGVSDWHIPSHRGPCYCKYRVIWCWRHGSVDGMYCQGSHPRRPRMVSTRTMKNLCVRWYDRVSINLTVTKIIFIFSWPCIVLRKTIINPTTTSTTTNGCPGSDHYHEHFHNLQRPKRIACHSTPSMRPIIKTTNVGPSYPPRRRCWVRTCTTPSTTDRWLNGRSMPSRAVSGRPSIRCRGRKPRN